jgi:hypothetical protein
MQNLGLNPAFLPSFMKITSSTLLHSTFTEESRVGYFFLTLRQLFLYQQRNLKTMHDDLDSGQTWEGLFLAICSKGT